MTLTTSSLVVRIIGIIWIFTLVNSLIVMFGGERIFKKAAVSRKIAFYPIINLFSLMEISDVSTFLGILLFIPGFNVLISMFTFYKLGKAFNVGIMFRIGLAVLPIIFFPMLAFGDYRYKATDEKYFRAMDDASGQRRNLMMEFSSNKPDMPDIDESKMIEKEDDETPEVDSVFKTRFEVSEQAAPYKAVRIDAFGMERLKDDEIEDDVFKPKIEATPKPEEKKDDFEVIDL